MTMHLLNRKVYTGDRNESKQRHGQGKNIFPNGDSFIGSYDSGKRSGHGFYKWKSGHRYVGNYLDNQRDGNGSFIYPDGSKYSGQFSAGKRHGTGIYTFANGDQYNGEWSNDKKHGQGTYTYAGSGSKKIGVWNQGVLQGAGVIQHADVSLSGKFLDNDLMDVPVTIKFHSTNYEKKFNNPGSVNMEPVSTAS